MKPVADKPVVKQTGLVTLPWSDISRKVKAGGISGALVTILLFISERAGWGIDVEVATSMVLIATVGAGYLTRERADIGHPAADPEEIARRAAKHVLAELRPGEGR